MKQRILSYMPNQGIVATVGVENLVVVQTKDAVLVSERNKVQDVKKIVEQIKIQVVASIMFIAKYIVLGVNMIPLTQGSVIRSNV